jgi:hypothetical protein
MVHPRHVDRSVVLLQVHKIPYSCAFPTLVVDKVGLAYPLRLVQQLVVHMPRHAFYLPMTLYKHTRILSSGGLAACNKGWGVVPDSSFRERGGGGRKRGRKQKGRVGCTLCTSLIQLP